MSVTIDNIASVMAMGFPAGRLRDGGVVALPGLIMLQWWSSETDKLFQAYINGRLAGVTVTEEQRVLLVSHDHNHPATIEIVAVTPTEKDIDHAEELSGFTEDDGSHVMLSWPRLGVLPMGSEARIFWNSGEGEIDYDNPVATQTVWPDPAEKWGWGMDGFGEIGFGYGGGSIGMGQGVFGVGEFGFDAEMMTYESASLPLGTYEFCVRLADKKGNIDEGDIAAVEVSIDPLPEAPRLALESYDGDDGLALNIT